MQPDFWHARWRRGQIGFHQDTVNQNLIDHADTLLGDGPKRVLVPLCGKSMDLHWIAARGHEVVGTELSSLAAKQLFESSGRVPTITDEDGFQRWQHESLTVLVGDMLKRTEAQLGRFDRIWDRAALIALPPTMRATYVAKLLSVLKEDGAILLNILRNDLERSGPPHSVTDQEVTKLYGDVATLTRLSTRDVLDEEPKWRASGATEFVVTNWWIQRTLP